MTMREPFRGKVGDRVKLSAYALAEGLGNRNPDRIGTVRSINHTRSGVVGVRWDGTNTTHSYADVFIQSEGA